MFESYGFRRIAAKGVDLLVGFALASMFAVIATPLGVLIGTAFLAISDAIGGGEGVGKRFFKIRVESTLNGGGQVHWKQSVLRNVPFLILLALFSVAYLGFLLGCLFGVPYCLFEIYLFLNVQGRQRLGDVLANTRVVEVS